jgi:hypothetical protein
MVKVLVVVYVYVRPPLVVVTGHKVVVVYTVSVLVTLAGLVEEEGTQVEVGWVSVGLEQPPLQLVTVKVEVKVVVFV